MLYQSDQYWIGDLFQGIFLEDEGLVSDWQAPPYDPSFAGTTLCKFESKTDL